MRGTIVVTALALTAATLSLPVDALAGLMPSSTLQKELSTNIEQVRGFVARGPRGGVVAGRSGYRGGVYRGGVYRGAVVRPGVAVGVGAAAVGAAAAGAYYAPRCGYYPYPPCY